jgi:hypothetical protein
MGSKIKRLPFLTAVYAGGVSLALMGLCVFSDSLVAEEPRARANAINNRTQLNQDAFARADTNGDGKLTLKEFDDYVITIFSAMDGNQDKVIDHGELKGLSQAAFGGLDLATRQRVTFRDFMQASHRNFINADKDKSKWVSLNEVNNFG